MVEKEAGAVGVADEIEVAVEDGANKMGRAKEAVRETVETARKRVRAVSDDLRTQASKATEVAKERYGTAKENVRHGYDRARKDVDQLIDDVNVYVRDNPGRSVLIAAGLGFALGFLLRGDRRR
ncbi:MAG TPA: hypothetical protein VMT85_08720 [Thermoanaerobaculia bacterium]|nr:hypothetical protein [Thermoanaerobaculia bacterium]